MKFSLLKSIGISVAMTALAYSTHAQTYVADFEDASKTGYGVGTITTNGHLWELSGAMVGNQTNDMKNGAKATRLRHVDSISCHIELMDNFSGVSQLSFYYSRAMFSGDTAGVAPTFVVYHTADDGASWEALDTINLAGVNSLTLYNKTFSPVVNGRFRIKTISGDLGKRFNIDDVTIVSSTPMPLLVTDKTPVGPGVPLSTNQLTVKFNMPIAEGTGAVALMKSGSTTPVLTYTMPSSSVTISADSTAVMTGVALDNNTTYYVVMTEGAFTSTGTSAALSPAIADSTTWRFTTVDTTPVVIPVYTSLNETFTGCDNATSSFGTYTQYSVEGVKRWGCNSFGNGDSACVSMNGGSGPATSEASKDYLLSKGKYDFSAMTNPKLSFFHKYRFGGTVTTKVKISTDYAGTGDPSTATWTDIYTIATPADSNAWVQISNIDLTPYKTVPFFLSIYYECGTTGAYQYYIDDIKVDNASSIFGNNNTPGSMTVLGIPTNNHILIQINATTTQAYTFEVIDLTGRVIGNHTAMLSTGTQRISLDNLSIPSGLYIIKATDASGAASTVKAAIQ